MRPTRRQILAGIAGTLLPATPGDAAGSSLRDALDTAAAGDPATGLRLLAGFEPRRLALPDRLDLETARAGLAIDAAIARLIPARPRGRGPYRLTPAAGAWKAATPDPAAIDADTAAFAGDARAGILPPRADLDRTLTALAKARAAARPDIAAALDRQITTLAALAPNAPEAPGMIHLPDGRAWYALLIRRTLGSTPPPATIRRRLLAEMARLHTRADRHFAAIGMPAGSIADRYVALFRDPRWLYPDDTTGHAAAIADMARTQSRIVARMAGDFGPIPAWCLNVAPRALTPVEIAAGKGGYRIVPTPRAAGCYIVDLRDIRRRPLWSLPSVVAHELLPGHMLQLGLEGEAAPHPLRLDHAAAFVEGWGIYAEIHAANAGLFAEPRDALGHVHWLIFRVARALVDLGIHHDGWSIAQAEAQWRAWQGEPVYFASFENELARIPLEPATRVADCLAGLALAGGGRGKSGAALARYHHMLLAGGRRRLDTTGV